MKKIAVVFFAFCINFLNTTAQQSNNNVYLLNEESKLPVTAALVTSGDKIFNRLSDETGKVSLAALKGNDITISAIGYVLKTIALNAIPADGKIWLKPTITSLQEIKVNAAARTGIFHTISDLDIHLRPLINSQEVLRIVPGLFMGQHAGGGKAEQIFLRGFDIDHGTDISISADGLPVNMVSHAHGQGYADLHYLIPELIEQVQFGKGPYQATKGNFATAGYVDLQTKDRLGFNSVKVEGGQYLQY
ncbi:MAG: hypothetical protein EOO89_22030 [Pedobacter sp.]|nr:MAG: hypothetical protein EOO89_22030 [Pedobacter sp.]